MQYQARVVDAGKYFLVHYRKRRSLLARVFCESAYGPWLELQERGFKTAERYVKCRTELSYVLRVARQVESFGPVLGQYPEVTQ